MSGDAKLCTRIRFAIDIEVATDMMPSDLIGSGNHGISNFCHQTRKNIVQQLEATVAEQCATQHAEVFADAEAMWQAWGELCNMVALGNRENHSGYVRTQHYNHERAKAIQRSVEKIFSKYHKSVPGNFLLVFKDIDHFGT